MTRHGPLTAQGLGRSPYDDVFQGEGEANPQGSAQRYDERGRPVNPETRRINRDVIRSHNEVMQVIGVAEPDNSAAEAAIEDSHMMHHRYEDGIGQHLLKIGRIIQASAAWGMSAMRHRTLLYKRYQYVPLVDLWAFGRTQRSLGANLFAGYPAFASVVYLRIRAPFRDRFGGQIWYHVASTWIRLHLTVYGFLQQMDVYPAYQILPNWRFFIPFSSMSPIPAPPPPTSFTAPEILTWVGRLAVNAAPLIILANFQQIWHKLRAAIWFTTRSRLPQPHNRRPSLPSRSATVPPPPEEISHMTAHPPPSAAPAPDSSHPLEEGASLSDGPVSLGTVRRRSTFSTTTGAPLANEGATSAAAANADAGDFYPSDDEDNTGADMVSTTLISFDVEATDAVDPPPGVWSAELRPNVVEPAQQQQSGGGGGGHDPSSRGSTRTPVYRENALTRLPAMLATDFLTVLPTRILTAPSEAIVYRLFLRSVLASRRLGDGVGPGPGDVYGVLDPLPWRAVANFVGLELVHLLVQAEIWAALYQAASWCRASDEEWKEMEEEDERERLMNEAHGRG